jgi:hypothetical protein
MKSIELTRGMFAMVDKEVFGEFARLNFPEMR